jgi:hypothetical protein
MFKWWPSLRVARPARSPTDGSRLKERRSQEGARQKTDKHGAKAEQPVSIQPDQQGNGLIAIYDSIHLCALN